MDFMSDALFNGRRLRVLTVLDIFTRESLTIQAGKSIKGEDVVSALEWIAKKRGLPEKILCDNGPEFVSRALDAWAYAHGVSIDFSRPANQRIMPTSRRSTAASARSA